jgi:hypothetical protein
MTGEAKLLQQLLNAPLLRGHQLLLSEDDLL